MIAMTRSQSAPVAGSQLAAFPQILIIPINLSHLMFRAWTEQIHAEFGTSQRSAVCAFTVVEWPREGLFAPAPTVATAGASITVSPVAVPSTAAIQKLHSAHTAGGSSAINAAHVIVMPVAVKPSRKGAEYHFNQTRLPTKASPHRLSFRNSTCSPDTE